MVFIKHYIKTYNSDQCISFSYPNYLCLVFWMRGII